MSMTASMACSYFSRASSNASADFMMSNSVTVNAVAIIVTAGLMMKFRTPMISVLKD